MSYILPKFGVDCSPQLGELARTIFPPTKNGLSFYFEWLWFPKFYIVKLKFIMGLHYPEIRCSSVPLTLGTIHGYILRDRLGGYVTYCYSNVPYKHCRQCLICDDCIGNNREVYQNRSVTYFVLQLYTVVSTLIWAVHTGELKPVGFRLGLLLGIFICSPSRLILGIVGFFSALLRSLVWNDLLWNGLLHFFARSLAHSFSIRPRITSGKYYCNKV